MSRRSAPSWLATQLGHVYTLHFWPPYGDPAGQQAKHYTGWARKGNLFQRLTDHALGRGARLTQVQKQVGWSWVVADVEHGVTADREAQLKERGASRRCSVCQAQRAVEAGRMTKEEALARSGWDRASACERSLLLEIFGVEKEPERIPEIHSPKPFVPAPSPAPVAEIDPELDTVVDALVASWTSPTGEASADSPGSQTAGMTPAEVSERVSGQAYGRASQIPVLGDFPGRNAETELEASA
jgi:predicted GIY-YIG superfamily endonuclease